jgi:hypothetical protein
MPLKLSNRLFRNLSRFSAESVKSIIFDLGDRVSVVVAEFANSSKFWIIAQDVAPLVLFGCQLSDIIDIFVRIGRFGSS